MLVFLAIGQAMADRPASTGKTVDAVSSTPVAGAWNLAYALPLALVIMAAPLYARTVLERGPGDIAIDPKLMLDPTLALDLGPVCKPDHQGSETWRPRFDRADMTQGLIIDCGGKPVDLFLAYYAFERDGVELIHHANRLADGDNWTRTATSWHATDVDGLPSTVRAEDLYGREAGDRLVLAWYWIGGQLLAKDWQAKAYQLYRRLLGDDGPVALIALSTAYDDRPEDALPDLEDVLIHHKGIADYLSDLAPPD
jgi:EpsI family protein